MRKNIFKFIFAVVLFAGMSGVVNAESLTDNWTKDSSVNQRTGLNEQLVIFSGKGEVNIKNDCNAFIVVEAGSEIVINLNGHTITSGTDWAGVSLLYPTGSQIHNYGNLTINGDGTIVNQTPQPGTGTYGSPTITNLPGAVLILNGGTYTRKKFEGKLNGGYVIRNIGELIINDNAILNSGDSDPSSSIISSGWNLDDTLQNYGYTTLPTTPIRMTINSATFSGGKRSINTEGNTVTTINGGSFENGTREIIKSASVTIINGGIFKSPAGKNVVATEGEGTFEIYNGEFSSDVSSYLNEDSEIVNNQNGTYSVEFIYADYSKIDELISKIEKEFDSYTEESMEAFIKEYEKIDFELGKSKQTEVDNMYKEILEASTKLVKIKNPATTNNIFTYVLSFIIMALGIGGCLVYRKKYN